MLAPVEVPRNASRAQIERPHQTGGNSADLIVSQGEVRRILLPRTPLNKSCAPLLLGSELAPELPRSHRLESDQRTH